jgi:hypothetical protein
MKRLELVMAMIFTISSFAIACVVVRREFSDVPVRAHFVPGGTAPVYIDEWKDVLRDGITMGRRNAPVQIIEFADLQCPACARWHQSTLNGLIRQFGDSVTLTIVHLPLASHEYAFQAAVASECAAAQGRFAEFVSVAYREQDLFGDKSWESFGQDIGVDAIEFDTCLAKPPHPRILRGKDWASRLHVWSTPTIIVNGWKLPHILPPEEFTNLVSEIVKGEDPFERYSSPGQKLRSWILGSRSED